ncbi:MAG: tRNA 2-selenouridine(34) synthase MnmH [Cyanobacteria bacterium J06642_2]
MSRILSVPEFLAAPGTILDVRSPSEFARGRVPGAVNFPLFTDDERAQVGTCYKQQGRDAAVELGLTFVGPNMAAMVGQAKALARDRRVRVHCWRGGMRSASVAWLLETAGFEVVTLAGGYKSFRRWCLERFEQPKTIVILGGMTGSGKTDILHALAKLGEPVLDLEGLACHRGSSYGGLMQQPQPSTEQFENDIALRWDAFAPLRPIWIEGESQCIGTCRIPQALFEQMMRSPVVQIERSRAERIAYLVEIYGAANREQLVAATERIRKRLGGARSQAAVNAIRQGNLGPAADLILDYYDKTYTYDLARRAAPILTVDVSQQSARATANLLRDRVTSNLEGTHSALPQMTSAIGLQADRVVL